jgi:DNA-binding NarL/FixJ family response regulator
MKKVPIETKVYKSIISFCEQLEHKLTYRGNGHHLAQNLSTLVSEGLLSKQQKEIYDKLTKTPKSTKEISSELNLSTTHVSSQLIQMYSKTLLIHFKINKNKKLWYR